MPIWIEAALGLAAIALCAAACWREDRLIAWEDKHLIPWAKRTQMDRRSASSRSCQRVGKSN